MLLTDVRILENIEIISEAKSPQGMRIRGLFQRADEENNNKRVYPLNVLESQVKSLQEMIKENRLCGELDHPSHDIVKLSNASHLITGLYMKGNDVIGEAKILDTPAGKVAQALIEGGVKIGISSRGVGTLSEDTMRKVKYVNDDYKLVTFDLVADPSTRGAFPSLSESTESGERTRKIVNDTYKKALGEKVFVTMLKESFDNSLQEADKPYENDESSYDEIMKMRGYPDVDEIMKRGNVKEDPFYKAMMAAVKGATPVKTKESKKNGKVRRQKAKPKDDDDERRTTDINSPEYAATHGRQIGDNTKPTHSRVAKFLAEVKKKVDESASGRRRAARKTYGLQQDPTRTRAVAKVPTTGSGRALSTHVRTPLKHLGQDPNYGGEIGSGKSQFPSTEVERMKQADHGQGRSVAVGDPKKRARDAMFQSQPHRKAGFKTGRETALGSMFAANKKTQGRMRQDRGAERWGAGAGAGGAGAGGGGATAGGGVFRPTGGGLRRTSPGFWGGLGHLVGGVEKTVRGVKHRFGLGHKLGGGDPESPFRPNVASGQRGDPSIFRRGLHMMGPDLANERARNAFARRQDQARQQSAIDSVLGYQKKGKETKKPRDPATGTQIAAHTQPTYSKMAGILGEAYIYNK